ncbi:MAG: rhomboid family intramembrane serine protease GlpG [Gammaproteobacteria bacterium]|nr:MAG: rhomboid family intramembrane serine protease GlpG [Gammaproteobacteria bacterium]
MPAFMQPLVSLNQHNIALLFSNYLNSQAISSRVEKDPQGFVVLCQSEHLAQAKILFDAFIEEPFADKYQHAAWQQGEITDVVSNGDSFTKQFKTQFLAHAGVVTLSVFVLCWLVFLFSIFGFARPIFDQLQFFQQLSIKALITEPWRLLGPAFFHFSWLHIVFNSMWWWQLGGEIEKKLSKNTLLNVFLITAIASNLGQYLVSGADFGGLSGVVYGLVGFIWWLGWLAPDKGLNLPKPLIGILLFWMLLGFMEILPMNMANTAHLLGLVSGCLLALFYAKQ